MSQTNATGTHPVRYTPSPTVETLREAAPSFWADLTRAHMILQEAGCTDIYVFGSLVSGRARSDSDIDLAVRGCPKGKFFHLLGQLMFQLEHPVDLVDLDGNHSFAEFLEREGGLVRIE